MMDFLKDKHPPLPVLKEMPEKIRNLVLNPRVMAAHMLNAQDRPSEQFNRPLWSLINAR